MENLMRTITIIALGIIILMVQTSGYARDAAPAQVSGHKLTITMSPSDNTLSAVDVVTLSGRSKGDFTFTLNKNLKITQLKSKEKDVKFDMAPYVGGGVGETAVSTTVQNIIAHLPNGSMNFEIEYSGIINDAINPSNALTHVRGDFTSGIISPDGIYMSSETGWYPDTEGSMATFEIEAHVPSDWKVVTQGDLMDQQIVGNESVSKWNHPTPYDGCVIVANIYIVTSRMIDGIKCSTYFLSRQSGFVKTISRQAGAISSRL